MDHYWSRRGALKALGAAGGIIAAGGLLVPTRADAGVAPDDPWARAARFRGRITPPRFPARHFDVTDYGADATGATSSTAAFGRAIRACHDAGGGHVVVPAGTFLTAAPVRGRPSWRWSV